MSGRTQGSASTGCRSGGMGQPESQHSLCVVCLCHDHRAVMHMLDSSCRMLACDGARRVTAQLAPCGPQGAWDMRPPRQTADARCVHSASQATACGLSTQLLKRAGSGCGHALCVRCCPLPFLFSVDVFSVDIFSVDIFSVDNPHIHTRRGAVSACHRLRAHIPGPVMTCAEWSV